MTAWATRVDEVTGLGSLTGNKTKGHKSGRKQGSSSILYNKHKDERQETKGDRLKEYKPGEDRANDE